MVFNSFVFIIFFTLVCAVCALTNLPVLVKNIGSERLSSFRHYVLLAASYIFYGWWNLKCCFIMLGLTAVSYVSAVLIEKTGRKIYLLAGVIAPLAVLGIFKYYNFFVSSFCAMLGLKSAGALNIVLPVGVSFYTFQSLSYTIDVYRKKLKAEKSFVKLALYIAFFPQLVAGPIVKSKDFLPQLYENRNITLKNLEAGVQIFVFGLFKKIVLADNISVFVDDVFLCPKKYHAVSVILAVVSYSIQIMCDFSGYSDMAAGCAKCLGYDLCRNFDLPYLSKNVTEFWKRWHISLSTWLQEYLYIPLGGNRKGKMRTYLNNFLTMLIGGLWHGAAWTFVAWGALHGAALCVNKAFMAAMGRDKNYKGNAAENIISAAATFIFVSFCWIFFRADSFGNAWQIITAIFTRQKGVLHISSWCIFAVVSVAVGYAAAVIRSRRKNLPAAEGFYPILDLNTVHGLAVFFTALGMTLCLAYTGNNPFIYFQF